MSKTPSIFAWGAPRSVVQAAMRGLSVRYDIIWTPATCVHYYPGGKDLRRVWRPNLQHQRGHA